MSYTNLHTHTWFNNIRLTDSINKKEKIIEKAYSLKMNGIALTDHEALSSFINAEKFLINKKQENIDDENWAKLKLIRGNEIYLVKDNLNKENFIAGEDKFYHFILLAKDYEGYLQLCELSSRAWNRMFKYFHYRVPTYYQDIIDVIQKNPGHIIGSTACIGGKIGETFIQALNKNISETEAFSINKKWLYKMIEIFGENNFYLEIQPGLTPEQIYVNKQIQKLHEITNIPIIITTDAHYINKEDRKIHREWLNNKQGDREVDSFYEATYIMADEEIHNRLDNYMGAENVSLYLQNTNIICDNIEDYSLLKPLHIPYLPKKNFDIIEKEKTDKEICIAISKMPNIKNFIDSNIKADNQFANRLIRFMFEKDNALDKNRIEYTNKTQRMNTELGIIWDSSKKQNVEWSKYFLQVSDYINIYWTIGDSLVSPRGSAAASYVCYALGIIQIDPTREKAPLIFERFMNPDRASVLDIDVDIESTKRNKCIQALKNIYGDKHVTRVATFKTEKARSAIITAARALDIDVDISRYISGLIKSERGIQYTLDQTYYGDEANDIKPNKQFIAEMNKYPKLWEIAKSIEGIVSNLGSHAGGIVITEEPIQQTCGIMKTSSGDVVTSYDLHNIEEQGLIKIDLLATRALTKIRTCLDLLCDYNYIVKEDTLYKTYNKVIGFYNINRDDLNMWKMIWNNEIISLFQMEQQSGMQGIALTKPSSLEDLATLNSVIRLMPPDKQSERPLEKFSRFKKDPTAWDQEMDYYKLTKHEKELLHKMFDYSNGISAQQEDLYQLMRCPEIIGYSFGQADKLRKSVAKKNPKDYQIFEEQFWKDVQEKGSSKHLCEYIWNVMVASQRGYSLTAKVKAGLLEIV